MEMRFLLQLNYQPGAVPSSPGGGPSSSQAESQSTEDDSSAAKVPVYNGQHCKYSGKMVVPAEMASRGQLCLVRLCNATLVFNRRAQMANFVESQLIAPIPNIDHRANCSGRLVVPAKQIPMTTTATTTTEETTTPTAAAEESAKANSMVKRSQDSTAESTEADKENAIRQSDPTISSAEDQPPPWDRPAEAGTSVETNSGAEGEATTTTTRMDPSAGSRQVGNRLFCNILVNLQFQQKHKDTISAKTQKHNFSKNTKTQFQQKHKNTISAKTQKHNFSKNTKTQFQQKHKNTISAKTQKHNFRENTKTQFQQKHRNTVSGKNYF
jgi:hypothetical protein